MMRFLGLAVTFGFIFIGWRIQQSILNPLLSKKKRQTIMKKSRAQKLEQTNKLKLTKKLVEDEESSDEDGDQSSPVSDNERMSYISYIKEDRYDSDSTQEIEIKIKMKKKQLAIMWFILIIILFIGFYEMVYSAVQRFIEGKDCNHLIGNDILDAILIFFSRIIGLLLWTWPLIYVYWGKEVVAR